MIKLHLRSTVVDAKQETENQIHELNSEFIGPIVCAGQLWIQSFCIPVKKNKVSVSKQCNEIFLKSLDTESCSL